MKNYFLALMVVASSAFVYSQTTKAIIIDNYNDVSLFNFNPTNAQSSGTKQFIEKVTTTPRDFIFDTKHSRIIYQNSANSLIVNKIEGNNVISSKTLPVFTTLIAPAFIPSSESVAFFNVQKEFNGYGSNEENLFFSKIDINTGRITNIKKFSDLSFDNVTAPFYGKISGLDRFTGKNIEKEIAVSKPLYIAEKDLYMIMVRDVTGTNRIYKMRINSTVANVVSSKCDFNIVDMKYVSGTNFAKVLFFETKGTMNELKVGDLDLSTDAMTNIAVIKTFNTIGKTIIDNGTIKFNNNQTQLYVTHYEGSKTNIYNLDILANQSISVVTYSGNVQFDYGFNESYYNPYSYNDVFGLYPNPSAGIFYFKNNSGIVPTSILVYDNLGQIVRSLKVEDLVPNTEIDLSNMAIGIYHIRANMPGTQDFIGKVIVTN